MRSAGWYRIGLDDWRAGLAGEGQRAPASIPPGPPEARQAEALDVEIAARGSDGVPPDRR